MEELEPAGFDYRNAIMDTFQENPTTNLKIDDVVRSISIKYNFSARKETVTNRMNYLADRDKKIERVPERRGYYRLPVVPSS